MAKVSLSAREGYQGKLGNEVFFKGVDGQTISRKLVIPKNPKTLAQRVQRVITKTVGDNYKVMKAICDHSFEGQSLGAKCANRFRSLNATRMRERAAYLQEQGISLYSYYNFAKIGQTKFAPAAVYISEGSLNQVFATVDNDRLKLALSENTYQAVINATGAQRGDQMTLVTVEKNLNNEYSFHYARIILDPRNENGAAPLSSALIVSNAVNCPNSRNKGSYANLDFNGGLICSFTYGTVVAAGIIMSRKADSKWLRSNCQLVLNEEGLGSDLTSLMDAASAQEVVEIDVDNEQFLNNAGVGGGEGSASAPATGSTTAVLAQQVVINGANQSIGGGSSSTTSLSSFAFKGTNLSQASFKMKKNGGADVAPTSTSDSQVSWTITGAAVSDTYVFYMDGVQKYQISVVQAGGGSTGVTPGDDNGGGGGGGEEGG